jgi:hypothetical protein
MEGDEMLAELRRAAEYLARTDKGRDAMRHVVRWLEASGLSLSTDNQECILLLIDQAWNGYAGTAREVMHDALGVNV